MATPVAIMDPLAISTVQQKSGRPHVISQSSLLQVLKILERTSVIFLFSHSMVGFILLQLVAH